MHRFEIARGKLLEGRRVLDMVGVDSLVSAESECTSIVIYLFRHVFDMISTFVLSVRHDFDMISTLAFSVRHDFDRISTQPNHVLNCMQIF